MKILIIGGSGLLGSQLVRDLRTNNLIHATFNSKPINTTKDDLAVSKLNILDFKNVFRIIGSDNWDLVLHAASIGDVDFCETNRKAAWDVNVKGTKNIVNACKKWKKRLIYFSTNAVYDGNNGPYSEKIKTNPINYYGKTKYAGEKLVRILSNSMILRLNTMYGWNQQGQRDNPATWLISKLNKNQKLKIVTDVYNNHLWVGFVSQVIKKILKIRIGGQLVNVGGADCISRYQFAVNVAQVFNLNQNLIIKASSNDFSSMAPRPQNTCFITDLMYHELGLKPLPVIDGLKNMKKQNEKNKI